jgi:hypothetical protein
MILVLVSALLFSWWIVLALQATQLGKTAWANSWVPRESHDGVVEVTPQYWPPTPGHRGCDPLPGRHITGVTSAVVPGFTTPSTVLEFTR